MKLYIKLKKNYSHYIIRKICKKNLNNYLCVVVLNILMSACNLIQSIYNNTGDIQYVNVKNNGAISDMPNDCAVEIACRITSDGPKPIATGNLKLQISGYIQMIKSI